MNRENGRHREANNYVLGCAEWSTHTLGAPGDDGACLGYGDVDCGHGGDGCGSPAAGPAPAALAAYRGEGVAGG